MKIFNLDVRFDFQIRDNIWGLFLLLFSILSFTQGLATTHCMEAYRKGDIIIPGKDELIRAGPFKISEIRTRNSVIVVFSNPSGSDTYQEDIDDFSIAPEAVTDLIRKFPDKSVAYLLIYKGNSSRKICGVDIGAIEILSYERAISDYRTDSSLGYSWFWISLICLIWLFLSALKIRRVRVAG